MARSSAAARHARPAARAGRRRWRPIRAGHPRSPAWSRTAGPAPGARRPDCPASRQAAATRAAAGGSGRRRWPSASNQWTGHRRGASFARVERVDGGASCGASGSRRFPALRRRERARRALVPPRRRIPVLSMSPATSRRRNWVRKAAPLVTGCHSSRRSAAWWRARIVECQQGAQAQAPQAGRAGRGARSQARARRVAQPAVPAWRRRSRRAVAAAVQVDLQHAITERGQRARLQRGHAARFGSFLRQTGCT
jgi:hypothetical protein